MATRLTAGRQLRDFVGCAWSIGPDPIARAAILWRETKNVRVRLGLARYHPRDSFAVRTRFGVLHFRDNFGDITNLTNLLFRRVYALPRSPGEGVILDVGANIGMAAVWFRAQLPGRPIHCFEPLVENTRMVALNCPDAVINRVAVGAAPGELTIDVDEDAVMASSIPWRQSAERRSVELIRLDDYVRANAIRRIAVLKIDAEGMELDVLRGAEATLQRTHQIVLETHGSERHHATMEALRASGFEVTQQEFNGNTGMVFAVQEPAARSALRVI